MDRLGGLVRLVRPLNVLMMALAVVVGAVLAAGARVLWLPGAEAILLAMIAAGCLGAAANAINDVFDREIDAVNRPERPIPAGIVTERAARAAWGALSALGIALAALISWLHVGIAVASVALLYLYSAELKRWPLLGNLAVAAVIGLALPFGGLIPLLEGLGRLSPVIAGALFAVATTLAREILKDVEDVEGDARGGARTLPILTTPRTAARLAAMVILLTTALLPAGLLLGLPPAFLALALPAAACLLAAGWAALGVGAGGNADVAAAGRASTWMKGAMLAGMAALALAAW